jgi:phenylalanyl-tRNA synthetase beta chain
MLEGHPKGIAYSHLVAGLDALPALLDASGKVLSLPPIINADETKVTTATRDLFLDATGPSLPIVERALAILATSLVELDESGQAYIERVEIAYPDTALRTPALMVEEVRLDPAEANRILGLSLSREECGDCLRRMRHGVEDGGSGALTVRVAAYRHDIMHPVDLIEDIAIAHGYHNFRPELVPTFTAGRPLPLNVRSRQAAAVLSGLGFLETLSLVLTSEREHFEKLLRPVPELRVTVQNPVSVEQTMLRQHLYSSLLSVLAGNTDHPLPQRIFEVGDVVLWSAGGTSTASPESESDGPVRQEGADTAAPATDAAGPIERRVIAGAVCATRAGYSEGRSALDALLRELMLSGPAGEGVEYRADENPSGIPGRCAAVFSEAGERIAELFELHPQVLENFGLGSPAVLFSAELGPLQY